MTLLHYDPILGLVGWEFRNPTVYLKSKKQKASNLENKPLKIKSKLFKNRVFRVSTPRESENAFAPKNLKNWTRIKH